MSQAVVTKEESSIQSEISQTSQMHVKKKQGCPFTRPGTAAVKSLKGFLRQMEQQILKRKKLQIPKDFELKASRRELEALESIGDCHERSPCAFLVIPIEMENEIFIQLLHYQTPHLMRDQAEGLQVLAASDLNSRRRSAELASVYDLLMTYVADNQQQQFYRQQGGKEVTHLEWPCCFAAPRYDSFWVAFSYVRIQNAA